MHSGIPLSRRTLLLGAGSAFGLAALAPTADAAPLTYRTVAVPVANLWRSPTSPRALDALSVRRTPDMAGWMRRLDAQPGLSGRLGLVGRLDSQLQRYEPVIVLATRRDGWTQVVAPWHPSSQDGRGYPGWLAPGHLTAAAPWRGAVRAGKPAVVRQRRATTFLAAARTFTGLPYLWAGASPLGVDCSGLVLLAARAVGVQVPRDADDQYRTATKVPLASVRPGDLYFFAHPGKAPHHVGIATRPGRMLNAPQTGTKVREESVTGARARTLVGAGRFAGLG